MNKTALTILVVAVVVLGGYFLLKGPEATAPLPDGTEDVGQPVSPSSEMPVPGAAGTVPEALVIHEVNYTNSGFSPSELKIKVGDTVTWNNKSSQSMWVASALHPTHIVYSGTSLSSHCPDTENVAFDACSGIVPGGAWSFTFTKAGTWGYHDHLHSSLFGKIIVE